MQYLVRGLILLFVAGVLFGCDNSLDPIDREKGLYSVYGALDIDDSTNYIRVKELNTPLGPDSTNEIDADVQLKNLETGNTAALQDTVVQFDGVNTHNFYTTMNITPQTDYKLSIERSDGRLAKAVTKTPNIASTQVAPQNEQCNQVIELSIQPVGDREELNIEVGFETGDRRYWANISLEEDEQSPERLYARFTPKRILNRVFNPNSPNEGGVCCFQLSSKFLYVRYTHYGPDFLKGTTDTVAIESGTGRFGSYYDRSFSFPIDTTSIYPPPPPLPSCLVED
jgi:hypothetical protein